jgi:hypothetical protein
VRRTERAPRAFPSQCPSHHFSEPMILASLRSIAGITSVETPRWKARFVPRLLS